MGQVRISFVDPIIESIVFESREKEGSLEEHLKSRHMTMLSCFLVYIVHTMKQQGLAGAFSSGTFSLVQLL